MYGLFWGGGKHIFVCMHVANLGGPGGILSQGNFDFGPFIRRNLVESGAVLAQTKFIPFIMSLKPLYN